MLVYEGIGRETGITIPSPYYTYCGMRESNVRVAAVTMYVRDVSFRWSRHFVDTADDTTYRRLLSTRCESLELSRFLAWSKRGNAIPIYVSKIVITEAGLKTRASIRPCEARSSISIVVSGSRRCLLYSSYLILLVQVMWKIYWLRQRERFYLRKFLLKEEKSIHAIDVLDIK